MVTHNILKKVYEATGGMCVADSVFSSHCYMVISQKNLTVPNGPLSRAWERYICVKKAATLMQQSSEWGMRIMQASFPRISDRITREERGEREVFLQLIVHLYNLCANLVHINQIQNTFMPELDQDIDLHHVANLYLE